MKYLEKHKILYTVLVVVSFLMSSINGYSFESLDEQQLDKITAGGVTENNEDRIMRLPFHIDNQHAKVDGEAIIIPTSSSQTSGSLMIQDGAQSHLNSMININAVNSPVEVLLNLNVNINSKIGSIRQNNIRPDLRW